MCTYHYTMPPVSRTNSVSQNVLICSYFQRPVKSGRGGLDHTEEDQPFLLNFEDIYFDSCGAMALCPLREGQASLAQVKISWPPSGTLGDCSERLKRTFHKQKASLSFTAATLQKETKQKLTVGWDDALHPCTPKPHCRQQLWGYWLSVLF